MADLDRRAALEAALDAAEEGNLEAPEEVEIEVAPIDEIAEEAHAEQAEEPVEAADSMYEGDEVEEPEQVEEKPALSRPSTWKKEYLPIWDKLTTGQQLTSEEALKLAEYSNQRESEYKKGVSTYKAEADRARSLEEAIAPFVPELQAQNISPAAWINNLGRAHMILTKAPYQEKVQMFQRLAQDYGIQFNQDEVAQPQQLDPLHSTTDEPTKHGKSGSFKH